jgi:hypothetical protein
MIIAQQHFFKETLPDSPFHNEISQKQIYFEGYLSRKQIYNSKIPFQKFIGSKNPCSQNFA